ncbi:MAG: hypothetical protein DMF58_01100 [Acidobacteria bacterium]|nr:MAG: hypothetical protein DMF58_01100 [Acidobacteriota bacterium]
MTAHPRFADPLPPGEGGRRPGEGLALFLLLIAIAAVAFTQSYERWLDPIIDTGRDLYIPEQLAHGARLYRDIRYQYPPFAPYLLALLTSIIGHSLASYTVIGLLQSIVIAAALWAIGRRTAGTLAGFAGSLFFVALSFCGATTWGANFLFPYSYGTTIGIALIVISLALFLFDHSSLALAALFFASWCKVEYALAALLLVVVLAAGRRISLRQIVPFLVAEVVAIAAAVLYFPHFRENVLAESLTRGEPARRFFESVSGVTDWRGSVAAALLALLGIVAIVWLLRSVRLQIAVPAVLAISILISTHAFFRAWGPLQIVGLVQGFRQRNSVLLTLSAFSIATTLRIPLNVSPFWYGFAFIVPTYALIAYVLFDYVQLGARAMWWLPLVALLCGRDLIEQHQRYAQKAFAIQSPRGTLYDVNPDRAFAFTDFLRHVHGGTLVVFPEGLTLNYLSASRNPIRFHTFTPVETASRGVEDSIVSELAATPPDRVVVLTRDVREYGYRGFGIDYDRRLFDYIVKHYSVIHYWNRPGFRMILLARGHV